jgi:archaellum component FlaG (FlaF/FlaG flagellin family)
MSPATIIEFLLWLLIAASVIAVLTRFAIDLFHLPIVEALGESKGTLSRSCWPGS